jgi:4-hydroxyphenylpyruvate dioxygenase
MTLPGSGSQFFRHYVYNHLKQLSCSYEFKRVGEHIHSMVVTLSHYTTKMPKCRPGIASMSLGRPYAGHSFAHKLQCAAKHGFEGVEIFYEDLEYLAKEQTPEHASATSEHDSPSREQLLKAAGVVREICKRNELEVISLQPFLFYEGLVDRKEHAAIIQKLQLWFEIVKILGTDVIQVPTQFRRDDGVTGDLEVVVADMVEMADLGQMESPPIKFAYEHLAWGTFIDAWEGVWEVVRRVDRWNFGVCLDTFNIVGRVWADPTREDGKTEQDPAEKLADSLNRMVKEVEVEKVWYVQVVGAERMQRPLVKGHEWHIEGQPARMGWSRNARLFYGEEDMGQYLPIKLAAKAILDPQEGLGFKGWVSMELFSRTMNDTAETVPDSHARRGADAWKKLVRDLDLR